MKDEEIERFYDVFRAVQTSINESCSDKVVTPEVASTLWDLLVGKAEELFEEGTSGTIWDDIGRDKVYPIRLEDLTFKADFNRYDRGVGHRGQRWWMPPLVITNCTFEKVVILEYLDFSGNLIFKDCTFHGSTNFDYCNFNGKLIFENCIFLGDYSAYDGEPVKFTIERSDFRENFSMRKCKFLNSVTFPHCTWHSVCKITNNVFSKPYDCRSSEFKTVAIFKNNCFKKKAIFTNCKFLDSSTFEDTVFCKTPEFHGATVHQGTSFYRTTFLGFNTEEDWRAYRTLKLKMNEIQAQDEEGYFFACEQRAKRKVQWKDKKFINGLKVVVSNKERFGESSYFVVTLSCLYDLISGYGERASTTAYWWVLQLTLFFAIYLHNANSIKSTLGSDSVANAFLMSVKASINPLSIFNSSGLVSSTSLGVVSIMILQSVISVSILTLLLLAIRRKFRKVSE